MTRDELISNNLGLVHSCANKFRNRGIEYDDLYSAGCLGLVKAADGFDETLGYRFSTYAVPAILGEIKRLFRDGGAVKVSRSLKEKSREAVRLRDELSVSLGREPTVSELSEKLGINEFETVELLNIAVPPASLTATDEEGERQIDIPVDFGEEQIQNSIALREIIGKMPESDRRLIELRYYKGLTQTVTAEKLGLSQVQVSRRERLLLQEMRRKMTG
ncbi:MAG: sigma-70 family RNA polymerase sigma factor [Ruminococcus sp.]|nr:sigma-70 family RNA polymerase sigma factor [Oscillospiraceae bacterium]MCI6388279.1 sigma-70 family RNA polymerase sigma factor [Ruminococcus sp.]MDD6271461.1 sigma-70 family RNA polymerase sigma factor [Ruminococcus sp.]MDY4909887.1 sigma-70 family RNA polymerase sigma factor [Candidatus Fimenecus sp.]